MAWQLKIPKYWKTTLALSNEDGESHDVKVLITRLSEAERIAFVADWKRGGVPPSGRISGVRRPDREDEMKRVNGKYVVPDEVIAERRVGEMTVEDHTAFAEMEAEEEMFSNTVLHNSIANYVRFPPGQGITMEGPDGTNVEILTGEQIMQAFGQNPTVILSLYAEIYKQNMLTGAAKKKLRSVPDSESSSAPSPLAPAGPLPATTAVNAEPGDSVPAGVVTESTADPSGRPPVH